MQKNQNDFTVSLEKQRAMFEIYHLHFQNILRREKQTNKQPFVVVYFQKQKIKRQCII